MTLSLGYSRWKAIGFGAYFLTAAFLIGLNSRNQLRQAETTPFSADEWLNLNSIRPASYAGLVLRGAHGQGNPSPLNFVICKALDDLKEKVNFLGLKPEAYFRIVSNAAIHLAALIVLGAFLLYLKDDVSLFTFVQLALLAAALSSFVRSFYSMLFSCDFRFYAIWHAVWFISLALALLMDLRSPIFVVLFSVLALTSNVAIFQIAALALGALLAYRYDRKAISSITVRTMALPLLIAGYYLTKVRTWGFGKPQWAHFLLIWEHAVYYGLPLVGIALCFAHKKTRRYSVSLFAVLVMYLSGPLFFQLIVWKKYVLSYRYFSYYDLALPVFLLTLIPLVGVVRQNVIKIPAKPA